MTLMPEAPGAGGPQASLDRVMRALEAAGCRPHKEGPQHAANCCMPSHEDPHASLKIKWVQGSGGGKTMLYCHACQQSATGADLAEALGLSVADLFDEPLPARRSFEPLAGRSAAQRRSGQRRGKLGRLPKALVKPAKTTEAGPRVRHQFDEVEVYPYTDAEGTLVQEVVRKVCQQPCAQQGVDHKSFTQRFVVAGQRLEKSPEDFSAVLYRLPQVHAAIEAGQTVWLLEGEKDVHTAEALDLVATTNTNGGAGFTRHLAESLRGASVKAVLDRDKAGYQRGVKLLELLEQLDVEPELYLPATTEDHSDFTDHVEAGLGLGALERVHVDELRAWVASAQVVDAAEACSYAAANALAYHELVQAGGGEEVPLDEAQRARQRWTKEAEIRYETVQARLQDMQVLVVKTGTEWAAGALAVEPLAEQAHAKMVRAHEAAGIAVPVAPMAGPPAETPPVKDSVGSPAATPTQLLENPDNETGYRILNGRIVEIKPAGRNSGGDDDQQYSVKPVLSLAVQVVEREIAEPEDTDETLEELMGRESRGGSDLNPPPPVTPVAWVVQYVDPASSELMRLRIDAEAWEKMAWLDSLPGPPDFARSMNGRKGVQDAIFAVSPPIKDTIRYRSTGWRTRDDGSWQFVHAGGAITAAGNTAAPVLLGGALGRYDLPDPSSDPETIRAAFRQSSGGMLDAFPRRIVAPLLGHVWRSAIKQTPWVLTLTGSPGSYKTAFAAFTMQHWGEQWTNDRPGTSGGGQGDTLTAMRIKLHAANHVLFWDDDFAPTDGIEAGMKRLGQFIKMVANGEARERGTRDGQGLLGGTRPRASGIATSELVPRVGGEARRALNVPMRRDEIDFDALLGFDAPERRYQRALLMASFLRWLAGDLPSHRAAVEAETARYREKLRERGHDLSLATATACTWSGWALMCQFLLEVGAISADEQQELHQASDAALLTTIDEAVDPETAATSGAKVRQLLVWALQTGAAYVDDVRTGEAPPWPLASQLGWERTNIGSWDGEPRWRIDKSGIRLGHVMHDPGGRDGRAAIYAYRSSLDQVIQLAARQLGDAPQIDVDTALRALLDEKILQPEWDQGRNAPRTLCKRTIHCLNRRDRVAVLLLEELLDDHDDEDDGQTGGNGGGGQDSPSEPPLFDDHEATTPHVDALQRSGVASTPSPTGLASPTTEERPMPGPPRFFTNTAGHRAERELTEATAPCRGCGEPTSVRFDDAPFHIPCFEASTHGAPATPDIRVEQDHGVKDEKASVTRRTATDQAEPFRAAAAVADVDGIWLPGGDRVDLPQPLTHVGHLAETAYTLNLGTQVTSWRAEQGQLWVTGALLAQLGLHVDGASLPTDPAQRRTAVKELTGQSGFVTGAIEDGWQLGGGGEALAAWTRVWRGEARGIFVILMPGLPPNSEDMPVLEGEPTPALLSERLQHFANALHAPFAVSPSTTGLDLMKTLRAKDRKLLFTVTDPVQPATVRTQERDFNWSRKPTQAETERKFVHVYDRGGSYAAGVAGLELGYGDVEHHEHGLDFDKKLPGYWRFDVPAESDWRHPHPLNPTMAIPAQSVWATTPTVTLAYELGYEVPILEAYVWPQHRRILDPWYERIRDARSALDRTDADRQAARNQLKLVYTYTIGILTADDYMRGKEGYRPDWRHHIIAKARTNILRRVLQIGRDADEWPLAVTTDSIIYASDEQDPLKAWPGKPEHLGRGLGQYKPEGTALLADHMQYLDGRTYKGDRHFDDPVSTIGPAHAEVSDDG